MIRRLAHILYRSSGATPAARRRAYLANITLAATLGVVCLGALAMTAVYIADVYSTLTPTVALDRQRWVVLEDRGGDTRSCESGRPAAAPCPAAAVGSPLWEAAGSLKALWTPDGRLAVTPEQAFWLGATIQPDELARAAAARANQLVLGYLLGSWEIWVDGESLLSGSSATQSPIVVPLAQSRLNGDRPLRIAIRVVPNVGDGQPVLLGVEKSEGLSTPAAADAYRVTEWLETQVRPWALLAIYLTFSWIVLMVWYQNRVRQEYFYVGIYALFHAIMQAVRSDTFYSVISTAERAALQIPLAAWESCAALFLGLALARTRRTVFVVTGVVGGLVPWAFVPFVSADGSADAAAAWLHAWLVPAGYLAGAGACALQAWYVTAGPGSIRTIRKRGHRLLGFAAGLMLLAVAYRYEAHTVGDPHAYAEWHRTLNVFVVIAFFWLAVRDFREIDMLARNAPVSQYHRKAILPDSVFGTLVLIDLKNSEGLFAHGAMTGRAEQIVLACVTHMWSTLTRFGGMVLQSDGDSLIVFFEAKQPETRGADAVANAAEALEATAEELSELSSQLVAREIVTPDLIPIRFRAAQALGEIRPIWQEVNNERYPSWTSAGRRNVFLDVARLIDLERQVNAAKPNSAVVMKSGEVAHLPEATRTRLHWLAQGTSLIDKHGNPHDASVYSLGSGVRHLKIAQ